MSNWNEYARKYGYDILFLDRPLDVSERARKRSPAWQKCLVLSQDFSYNYERIVWVDVDILINPTNSPCIAENVPIDKVGAVNAWASPTSEFYKIALDRKQYLWKTNDKNAMEYYTNWGLPNGFESVVQSGVMVLSPLHHQQILERVYFTYEDRGHPKWNYEMRPLSYELIKDDNIYWIDHRFNSIWPNHKYLYYPFLLDDTNKRMNVWSKITNKFSVNLNVCRKNILRKCATSAYINSYFLHFAASLNELQFVDTGLQNWQYMIDI
jgi:hypothetical protein